MSPNAKELLQSIQKHISGQLAGLGGADYREVVEELEDHLAALRMAFDESEPE